LDVLAKYEVRATFFLVGNLVKSYAGEVQRMQNEGHAIGVHSWDHNLNWGTMTANDQTKQIQDTLSALKGVLGQNFTTNLFRAPGGATTRADLSSLGMYNYNWSHDTYDFAYNSIPPNAQLAERVANNALKGCFDAFVFTSQGRTEEEAQDDMAYSQAIAIQNTLPLRPIILIHSIHPVDPGALDFLIPALQGLGYTFGLLPRPGDPIGTQTPISG
jgi:peptidoglycan/xylan/chitin deacetylase (PgdA/CDA1 family)